MLIRMQTLTQLEFFLRLTVRIGDDHVALHKLLVVHFRHFPQHRQGNLEWETTFTDEILLGKIQIMPQHSVVQR